MSSMDPNEFRDYVAAHVADYQRTDGEVGAIFNGIPCVVLTTVGARSGIDRHSPVVRVAIDGTDDYVVVASMGGAPTSPSWYFNITADPESVRLQDRDVTRQYSATETTGDERAALWDIAVGVYPPYADYQTRTDRVIPVLRLRPIDG